MLETETAQRNVFRSGSLLAENSSILELAPGADFWSRFRGGAGLILSVGAVTNFGGCSVNSPVGTSFRAFHCYQSPGDRILRMTAIVHTGNSKKHESDEKK